MSALILPNHYAVDDLVEAVSKMLEPLAVTGKLEKENRWGILVQYSRREPGRIRFTGVTHDDIEFQMELHVKHVSRELMQEMFKDILDGINLRRKGRQEESIPYSLDNKPVPPPLAEAVRRTLH